MIMICRPWVERRRFSEVVLVVLLMMVKGSEGLRHKHPMRGVADRVNQEAGPFFGLVMACPTEEFVLQDSALFVPNSFLPWVHIAGRRFNIGKIKGVDVIYVMTGELTLNAGITVQILLDTFDIRGAVHYGAGSTNDSLYIGDVSVPKQVAYTASWKWMEFKSEKVQSPALRFGAYNFPTKGDIFLAKIEFTPQQVYSTGHPMKEAFWLPVEPKWFGIATRLQDLELQQCINETHCLPRTPRVVFGLRSSTADVFLDNAAYRDFLFKEFLVSTVDEESSAVVMTCISNGVPCIVFRGISDMAGEGEKLSSSSLRSLAAANTLSVALEFIGLITQEGTTYDF